MPTTRNTTPTTQRAMKTGTTHFFVTIYHHMAITSRGKGVGACSGRHSSSRSIRRVVPIPKPPGADEWERRQRDRHECALARRMTHMVNLVPRELRRMRVDAQDTRQTRGGNEKVHKSEQHERAGKYAQRNTQGNDPASGHHQRASIR